MPVYLGLSTLEISKKLMYEFWYDYIKPKYQSNEKICYVDTDSFIIDISMKILLMMLNKYLIYQIMKSIDHYLNERIEK